MKRCLVIGKGDAFHSFVHTLSNGKEPAFLETKTAAFSLTQAGGANDTQRYFPLSFDDCYRNQEEYHSYDSVYLFVDELEEGCDFITLFRQLNTRRIFVITQRQSFVSVYKRLGANHVILSLPEQDRAKWLAVQIGS
ncbi:hypothetical protein EDM59_22245 [Brevibacillus nitrificans]|uniref:Uncharacterized protein n=1 Tax=Brevibacillus nitrificans TaxID=651560 RepID=A0A3M8CZW3_9BACL|nr:hypothetical protein [Brevibacillus nitrificans]RNB81360.1 hypothetical protein EDM59_22245 [Brevibacillus nitrificans]